METRTSTGTCRKKSPVRKPVAFVFSRESADPLDPDAYYQSSQCYSYCRRHGFKPKRFLEADIESMRGEELHHLTNILNAVIAEKPEYFVTTGFNRISANPSMAYWFIRALQDLGIEVRFADYDFELLAAWHKQQEIEGILWDDSGSGCTEGDRNE